MGTVTFVDEETTGRHRTSWPMDITEERLTAAELIRRRVYQEVAEYNARQPEVFHGLVRPTEAERTPNGRGYRMRTRERIDPEEQYERTLAAFRANRIVLLVGDRQILVDEAGPGSSPDGGLAGSPDGGPDQSRDPDPDQLIDLPLGTEVVFLKLVPLVGG